MAEAEGVGQGEHTKTEQVYQLFRTPAKFQPKHKGKRTPKRKHKEDEDGEEYSTSQSPIHERPRTPSGQVLSASIGQIKHMLKACYENPNKIVRYSHDDGSVACLPNRDKKTVASQVSACDQLRSALRSADEVNRSVNMIKGDGKQTLHQSATNCDALVQSDQTGDADYTSSADSLAASLFDENKGDVQTMLQEKGYVNINRSTQKTAVDGQPSTQTMDVRTVVKMLEDLKVELKDYPCSGHTRDQQETEKEILSMSSRINILEAKERMLIDTVAGMADKITELQEKLEIQDINSAKRTLIMTGFEGSQKPYVLKRQLSEFFHEEMCITVDVEDVYRIGASDPREIVVVLLSANQKKAVFQNIKLIKHYTNSKGNKYYFRDFLTTRQNELRKRAQEITKEMEKDPVHAEEVKTAKGKIYIGENEYKKKIVAPDPTKVLRMSMDKLNQIMSIQLQQIPPEVIKDNVFTGYSLSTNKCTEVQDAYMKVRLNHAEARHIVCVWAIPSDKEYDSTDYCDDDDFGAGCPIMDMIARSNINCRALFIVRNCGPKMNEGRIPAYLSVAEKIIKAHPINTFTNKKQLVVPAVIQENPTTYAAAVKSPPGGAQGRLRGRGRGNSRGRGGNRRGGRKQYGRNMSETKEKKMYTPKSEEYLFPPPRDRDQEIEMETNAKEPETEDVD